MLVANFTTVRPEMGKTRTYEDFDITIIYRTGDINQINRLKKYCRVKQFNGKIIKRERLYSEEKTLTLNLENLHSGTYIYTINHRDFSKTGKLIKKL